MNNKVYVGIVVVVIIAFAGFAAVKYKLSGQMNSYYPVPTNPIGVDNIDSQPIAMTTDDTTVEVLDNGFNPKSLTVKVGSKVTWNNNSGGSVSINSDPHPVHSLFPFLNLGEVANGASGSVTFEKVGTFTYHNHFNASQKGTIVVE